MATEDFKKLVDDVRQVSKDLHNRQKGSVKRANILVNKLRLQRLDFSVRALTTAIEDAKKNMPRSDW